MVFNFDMEIVFSKVVKMAYCKKCRGKFMADVQVEVKQYGQDFYFNYKTLNCPCYGTHQQNFTEEKSGQQTFQM